ncbi:hypothetical protein CDAR_1861 [Caerostris darwini]|uniref:Uncharacterized protein n=1 Tax=Caerostris darwini TaxID=1538125 RepID=A0AAV4R661_9ARAC|nr:hypothetical protein CDAR_1861 [Caerostris darwini]
MDAVEERESGSLLKQDLTVSPVAVRKNIDGELSNNEFPVCTSSEGFLSSTDSYENSQVKKKIILKRNNIPISKYIPTESDKKKSNEEKSKEMTFVNDGNREGVARIFLNAGKTLTQEERLKLRTKRFNIAPSCKKDKNVIAPRNPVSSSSSSLQTSSNDSLSVRLTAVQRRAFRFGVDVSKVLKQLDSATSAQQMKRKSKFSLKNENISIDDQERKKKRAIRFGIA